MRGQLLDIEEHKTMGGKNLLDRRERQIGKVFVVDGIELVLLHKTDQMWNSIVTTPPGFSRSPIPATKSLISGTCAKTLFPKSRSTLLPCLANL